MVRVEPDRTDELLAEPGAREFEMRGRPLRGWLRVDAEALSGDREFAPWVERGVDYERSLPPKR